MSQVYKIVGAFYRKPAQAILDCLAMNQKLYLRAEPDNQHDPNAIMVFGKRNEFLVAMTEEAQEILKDKCARHGIEWDLFNESNEYHLGYIPRDTAPAMLHEHLRAHGDIECFFSLDVAGKPIISVF